MQQEKNERMLELEREPVGRLLWRYSLPAIVGIVVISLYNVIDRIFIGQWVGPEAIAGLAITFPVMNLASAMGVLIGVGASARISIALGQKDINKAEQILGNSLVMTLLFGIVYIIVFSIFLDDILMAFGASKASLPYAHDFMAYIMPGMLIMNLCYNFNGIMRASGYPKRAMITMFIGAGLNVILAPVFIYLLKLGIKGAAIATDISMTVSTIFVMVHFFSPSKTIYFHRGIYRLKWSILISIFAIGAAPFIVNVAGSAINAIVNNFLYIYGNDSAVGAMGIVSTITQLLVMVVIGVCQGMQPIIGYNFGARRYDRLKRAYWLSVLASTLVCAFGEAISLLFPDYIARAFTTDASLTAATTHAFHIIILMFWVVGFQIVSTNFFQSLGKAFKSILLSLSRQVIFIIPLLFTLPRLFNLDGVWASFPISDLGATLVTVILIIDELRKLNRILAAKQ
jgi:putative MATE family efflux protein